MPIPLIGALVGALKFAFVTGPWYLTAAAWMGASYAINQLLAPSIKSAKSRSMYAFGSQTTEEQGGAVPVAYGTNRIEANIVGHFCELDQSYRGSAFSGTTVTRRILCCFGEGPIAADGLDEDSIRINGRPLSDMPEVSVVYNRGLVEQEALTGFDTFRQDYHIGQVCNYDEPVTFTLNRTGFDDLEIHLGFPKGLVHYESDGGTDTLSVGVKIEIGDAVEDTWHTLAERTIVGRAQRPLRIAFVASETYTGGSAFTVTAAMRPRVRVTRTTEAPTKQNRPSEMELTAVQVVRDIAFEHPGMVMMGLSSVPTEITSGGIQEISVVTTGKIVADGSGGFDVSRYHADAIRDILTQPVIEGDGDATPYSATYYRGVDPDRIIDGGFAAQKTMADYEVDDGLGGTEALLRCDAVFASPTTIHAACGLIAVSGRCGIDYRGRYFGLWLDSGREPVGLLCDGNWLADGDNRPTLTPVAADDLASSATARFRDEAANYQDRPVWLVDHDSELTGDMNLDLAAVTRVSEVERLVRRELARNRLVDATMTCSVDIDAIVYDPGDVVYCQIDGRSIGGRVTAVDGRTITLSMAIDEVVTGDDIVVVQVHDAADEGRQKVEVHPVSSVGGSMELTIGEDWTVTPAVGDAFLFGPADIADDQFEIADIAFDPDLHGQVSLTRYVPSLDDLDDLEPGVVVPLPGSYGNPTGGVAARPVSDSTVDAIGTLPERGCDIGNYTFSDAGGGAVAWESLTDEDDDPIGYVRYDDEIYQPADNAVGTTDRYIYWDPADPDVFQTSDDLDDVYGLYLACINDGGTPLPQHGRLAGSESFTVGISGTYTLAEVASITIVNGQITAVLPRVLSGSAADTATAADAAVGSIS